MGFDITRPLTEIQTTAVNYFEETAEITELEQSILNLSVVEESVATNDM